MATPGPATRRARPLRVALTGGIAAGKTEALRAFERAGAAVCSSDEIVHRLISGDPEVRAALEERYGTTDRATIAGVVFGDPDELAWLERLLHPRVRLAVHAWLEGVDGFDVAVVEIPLLYETGGEDRFDAVVVVTASPEVRRERGGEKVDRRSARLIPDEEKVTRADFAYENHGSLAELEAFVERVVAELRRP
jgi:dephospho-CoA kinase